MFYTINNPPFRSPLYTRGACLVGNLLFVLYVILRIPTLMDLTENLHGRAMLAPTVMGKTENLTGRAMLAPTVCCNKNEGWGKGLFLPPLVRGGGPFTVEG